MSQIQSKFIADNAVTNQKIDSGIDASKLADGSVSNTELQYINSLTENVQTALNAKALSATTISTAANSGLSGGGDLSANRSLLVDPNNAPSGTVATGDLVLIADISDSNNLKKVTAQSIADLAGAGVSFTKQTFTLSAGDITAQKVTLSNTPILVLAFIIKGGVPTLEGASHDYSVSGADINFLNDLATAGVSALVAGDVVQAVYVY